MLIVPEQTASIFRQFVFGYLVEASQLIEGQIE
jgi:hypothetical protein